MTPREDNAIRQIKQKLIALRNANAENDQLFLDVQDVIDIILALEGSARHSHSPTPNCRRATREELEKLCTSSNVVMFPAAA